MSLRVHRREIEASTDQCPGKEVVAERARGQGVQVDLALRVAGEGQCRFGRAERIEPKLEAGAGCLV